MTNKTEFEKYATMHMGIPTTTVESVTKSFIPTSMTPHIMEERQMNIAQMSVFDRLMMDRIIFLGTGINSEIANIVQAQLLFLQSTHSDTDITMYVNSPGGGVYAGLGIIATMDLVSPDIRTINTGMCASMGAVILAAGTKGKRSALKYSRTMIHQIMGGANGGTQYSDMQIIAKEMGELEKDLFYILSNGSNLTYDEVKEKSNRDYWMRPDEALELGFIDSIL